MTKPESAELPSYPALERCVLIDARMVSRIEIIKDIKACALFDMISEGKSLGDARSILTWTDVDACYLGPSVSPDKAIEFVIDVKTALKSKDCAFIAILNEFTAEQGPKLLEAGAHGIIIRPCNRMTFSDGTIRAIINANANGSWAGLSLKYGHEALLGVTVTRSSEGKKLKETKASPDSVQIAKFSAIMAISAPELKKILDGIESGELRLDPEGRPTVRAQSIIQEVVDAIIKDEEPSNPALVSFKQYFHEAILQWFIDLIQLTSKEATEKLRMRLLAYKPVS